MSGRGLRHGLFESPSGSLDMRSGLKTTGLGVRCFQTLLYTAAVTWGRGGILCNWRFESRGLGVGPRLCISNKLPDDGTAAGSWPPPPSQAGSSVGSALRGHAILCLEFRHLNDDRSCSLLSTTVC